MSCFKKVLLLLSIVGGINWGIYGIWGFNAVGWLLGGSMSWLSRTVFIIVGLSSLCLIPGLFIAVSHAFIAIIIVHNIYSCSFIVP